MRYESLCCVTSRGALRCHVMYAHVKSCHLLCPAMGWNAMGLNCHSSLNNYSVLQSTNPVLQSTSPVLLRHYSIVLPYKVRLQYYSVLQNTIPVLLCTTKYYSRTTRCYSCYRELTPAIFWNTKNCSNTTKYNSSSTTYYSVLRSTTPILLQYYSVVPSTTPVLLRTTKYYSSTTVYCKILLRTTKYYSSATTSPILQCTTPVLLQYYKVLLQYYKVLFQKLLCITKYALQSTTLYYIVCY